MSCRGRLRSGRKMSWIWRANHWYTRIEIILSINITPPNVKSNWHLLINSSFFNYFDAIVCSLIGSWSNWSDYGECSVTCGAGSQTRTRECVIVPSGGIAVPGGGGGGIAVPGGRRKRSTCSGDSMQAQECEIQSCSGTILHINSFLAYLNYKLF